MTVLGSLYPMADHVKSSKYISSIHTIHTIHTIHPMTASDQDYALDIQTTTRTNQNRIRRKHFIRDLISKQVFSQKEN